VAEPLQGFVEGVYVSLLAGGSHDAQRAEYPKPEHLRRAPSRPIVK